MNLAGMSVNNTSEAMVGFATFTGPPAPRL